MKFKKFTLLVLLSLFALNIIAEEIPLKKAKIIAKNLYFERAVQVKNINYNDIIFKNTFTEKDNKGEAVFYIFNLDKEKGFIIISAEDNTYPILGYSFENNYEEDNQPPAFSEQMKNYKDQIIYVRQNNLPADKKCKSAWLHFSSKTFKPDIYKNNIEPLITSTWDQDCYYSDSCPLDPAGACGHARIGCVSTAMSQIVRYHKYPPHGFGSHGYNSSYGYLFVNYANATYNWDDMPDYITAPNPEVAKICYHCGVAVNMSYGPQGSGAYSGDVGPALISYFGYDPSAHLEYRSSYSNSQWEQLLRDEISQLRPLYYSGSGSGGHAFVCDGYQNNSHFHFNWGWGGLYNGYFYLSSLNPGTHNYSNGQAALINLHAPYSPVPDFSSNITEVISTGSVNFYDKSKHIPTSWSWEFQGATPSTSNEKNPSNIVYQTPGTYPVKLTVSNEQGTNDTIKFDYITVTDNALPHAEFTYSDSIIALGSMVYFSDMSLNRPNSWHWIFQPNTVTFINSTSEYSKNPQVEFNEPVKYSVALIVGNINGSDTITKSEIISSGGNVLPFKENFELGSFKNYWTIENPDEDITWDGYYKLSGNENSRKAAWMNYYNYSSTGQRDRLISPILNFSNHVSPHLGFKHAYAEYSSSRTDSLIVYVSIDCGLHWTRVFEAGEDGTGSFATHQATTQEFVPSNASDWCGNGFGASCDDIDLTPWTNHANVKIMFESYNGHGNQLYIDDVIVYDNDILVDFMADKTRISPGDSINFSDLSQGTENSWLWNFQGATPSTSTEQNPENIKYNNPGSFDVSLTVSNDSITKVLTKENYITVTTDLPYVVQQGYQIDDSNANNNGIVDYNETILLSLDMENIGSADANNVIVTLSTDDEFVNITDNSENYGDIPANQTVNINNGFSFIVSSLIPDQHSISFNVSATDGIDTWQSNFSIIANAPVFTVNNVIFSDPEGNNNGRLDPGETGNLIFTTQNIGHSDAYNTSGRLLCPSNFITITNNIYNFDTLEINETDNSVYNIVISDETPYYTNVKFYYTVISEMLTNLQIFNFNIGLIIEDFEKGDFSQFEWQFSGDAPWTINNTEPYEGVYCAKSGQIGNSSNSVFYVTMDVIETDSISFYRKVSSESTYDFLNFYIDNILQDKWSGELPWEKEIFPVSQGQHTFKWEYKKDQYAISGEDCAWIDFITFPNVSINTSVNDIIYNDLSFIVYPNPFSDKININYTLKEQANVKISIYNSMGQSIKILSDVIKQIPGKHSISYNTNNLNPGLYFCKLETNNKILIKKIILLK